MRVNLLNVAVNQFFKVLQASRSSFLARTLLSALALSRALVPTGWPDDYPLKDGDHFDVIVVGSGSAGAIVAARLAEEPWLRVLLLEAGGDPPPTSVVPSLYLTLAGTEYDWNYRGELDKSIGNGRAERYYPFQRGKVLGGSSSVNYQIYTRGAPQDYDGWNSTAPGWSWNEVLYYFKKLEGMTDPTVFTPENAYLHSMKGPVLVSRPAEDRLSAAVNKVMFASYRELGIHRILESNGLNLNGATIPHYTFANGRRSSTAEAYLKNNVRPNLLVAKYSRATRVLIKHNNQDGTPQAYGVEVLLKNGKKVNVLANMEVVVSAGAIDTPKLLMLSGIGAQEELDKVGIPTIINLPSVGKSMRDHLYAPMTFTGKPGLLSALNNLVVTTHLDSAVSVPIQSTYFKLKSVPSENFDDRPQFQTFNFYVGAAASLLMKSGCLGYGYKNEVCAAIAKSNLYREIFQTLVIVLHPFSRGRVTVRSSNPLDDPYIETGLLRDHKDLISLREGLKFMKRLENTTYFRQNGGQLVRQNLADCNKIYYDTDEYWECYAKSLLGSLLHPVGTCRMGHNGVVDERLRVYGVGRLRIADASIMPTLPSGNTNTPTMMIGEKAADMIKEDLRIVHALIAPNNSMREKTIVTSTHSSSSSLTAN